MKPRSVKPTKVDYFKLSHPICYILIPIAFLTFMLSIFAPHLITWHFGPMGQLALYLAKTYPSVMFYLALSSVVIHVAEGAYCFYLCRKNNFTPLATLKWVSQTTVMGFFSLGILLKYIKLHKKEKK